MAGGAARRTVRVPATLLDLLGSAIERFGERDALISARGRWTYAALGRRIDAVAAGLGLNIFNRHADKLYMCNIAQMVNVLQCMLLTDGPEGKNCVRTTSYYAFMMFKPHRGATALKVEYDGMGAGLEAAGRGARGGGQDPSPELSVSASKRGNQMIVTLVNPRHDLAMEVDCALRDASAKSGSAIADHPPLPAL